MRTVVLALAALAVFAEEPFPIGPGITPPRVRKKVEPNYPPGAAELGLEAIVILTVVIDTTGVISSVTPLRLAGHGFDEAAAATVRKWRFHPGQKDNRPVPILATIQVNFRLLGNDQAYRRNRNLMSYNAAMAGVRSPESAKAAKGVESILALSKLNFAPAQFAEGIWRITGSKLPKDPAIGVPLLMAAAQQNFPAAVGQAGVYFYEGTYVPEDKPRGLEMMQSAAAQGSVVAQLFLGDLMRDTEPVASARYFRLCAGQQQRICQTRLAESLLKQPRGQWPEAIAWLQAAVQQKHEPAQKLLDAHAGELTPAEMEVAAKLLPMLVQK